MRRVICLLLVLAFCLCLSCPAFAVQSPGNDGNAPVVPDGPPKTGDTSGLGLWLIVMLLSLLALIVIIICSRKFLKD